MGFPISVHFESFNGIIKLGKMVSPFADNVPIWGVEGRKAERREEKRGEERRGEKRREEKRTNKNSNNSTNILY